MESTDLVHRLNRIKGQIEAISRTLDSEDQDCLKTMQLLKAANNALKKFGEAYVARHLDECIRSKSSIQDIEKDLRNVINASFTL